MKNLKDCPMINGINTGIKATTTFNRDTIQRQNTSKEIKQKDQIQLSRAEQIKEQIKKGEYKVDLVQTSEKMASNLLNL